VDAKGLILYFHGNGDDLQSWGLAGQELAERTAMNVWMFDYPGYGKSEGTISSEQQLHKISATFFEAAQQLAGGSDRIVLYGRSIGTGLAVKLASEYKVAALILESPYLSLQEVVSHQFMWVPSLLLKYSLRSDQWMPRVHSPAMILHGDRDEVIPFAQGKELATLSPSITFVPIEGGHHSDLSIYPQYWQAIEQFLALQ
jgi:uncharacterized protein